MIDTATYYSRICDNVLSRKLQLTGATLVVGPKWCGKTETALQAAASVIYIQSDPQYKETGKIMPSLLLEGETPRLIDEWQEVNPAFLMVLTGGKFAYQRKDGVLVLPLACLKN